MTGTTSEVATTYEITRDSVTGEIIEAKGPTPQHPTQPSTVTPKAGYRFEKWQQDDLTFFNSDDELRNSEYLEDQTSVSYTHLFIDSYRLVSRMAERFSFEYTLFCITLVDGKGALLEGEMVQTTSEMLKNAIGESLRKGDLFTCYSPCLLYTSMDCGKLAFLKKKIFMYCQRSCLRSHFLHPSLQIFHRLRYSLPCFCCVL